jgi:hypothetical protein
LRMTGPFMCSPLEVRGAGDFRPTTIMILLLTR